MGQFILTQQYLIYILKMYYIILLSIHLFINQVRIELYDILLILKH